MKIVKLVAENVKGLKAVEITPDENLQIISGANGQGKSSVLDSIWLAIGGSEASKGSNTTRPIRDGENHAVAQVDLGNIVVTRKWTSNDKSTLKVESKDGAQFKSPQTMLNDLIGKLSFDPLSFSNLDEKKQLETLLKMVDLPKDPAEIESEKKKLFAERTVVNREVKALKVQFDSLPYHEGVPEEEVQSSEILKEMAEAQKILQENNEIRNNYNQLGNDYKSLQHEIEYDSKEIERLENNLKSLKAQRDDKLTRLEDIAQEGSELQVKVQSLVDPDLSEFHNKLSEVDGINAKVRDNKIKLQREVAYDKVLSESNRLTREIERLEVEKQELIKSAKFPIDGLSFDENGVLYNGVPFKQCSSAERLKVSMAMAMALNPKLRVIRIMDGSLLDSKNLQLIKEMAQDKDYQVWVETVDESGKVGVVIENGEIKK